MNDTLNERINQIGSPSFKQTEEVKPVQKPTFKECLERHLYDMVNRCNDVAVGKDYVCLEEFTRVALEFAADSEVNNVHAFFNERAVSGKLFYEILGAQTTTYFAPANEV